MLRLAADADVHGVIIRGLRRRMPTIDLVRVQDALPEGSPDSDVLAWTTAENRVLITNDRNTMVGLAYEFVASGSPLPGLLVTTNEQSVGSSIDDLLLITEHMSADEVRERVAIYLPLRD
jgi:hypothetical protein